MKIEAFIPTKLCRRNKDFVGKRSKLIEEAINFRGGTIESPRKFVVSQYADNKEAFFFKPGKETMRKVPNVYDMAPGVNSQGVNLTEKWAFEKVWEYLIKVSIIQQESFKKILVLLYRLCYLIDHQENAKGLNGYLPSDDILQFMDSVQHYVLVPGFREKFGTAEIGIFDFLNFVDLLAWNEDVKYHHTENGKADFSQSSRNDVGRVNTVKSIISAPLLISEFITDVINKTATNGIIDVKLITTTIQRFSQSRGLCVLSNREMLHYLSPYLED